MIYPIYVYGAGILRDEATDVPRDYPDLKEVIANMFETMYSSNGVGLAAPQIGLPLRLFVVDVSVFGDDDPAAAGYRRVFVNPEIEEWSEMEVQMNEGCLSLPGIHEDVYRAEEITIHYWDENWVEHRERLTGWAARAVQHEFDHIDGVLFTDLVSPLRRTLLRNRLTAMSKGKYEARYRTRQK